MHDQPVPEPATTQVCRVLIAASNLRMRAALRALVEADGRCCVVAEARTTPETVVLDQELRPGLILLDLMFPTATDGLDAVRLLALGNRRPIVVLSPQEALRDMADAAGAAACVIQSDDADALLAAICAAIVQTPPQP